MRKIYSLLSILISLPALSFAQQTSVAAGGDATGPGGSVSYSIGQVVYTYEGTATGNFNQGVQQPYEIFTFIAPGANALLWSAFPNPSSGQLVIRGPEDLSGKSKWQLTDARGRIISSGIITEELTPVNMEQLPPATYLLNISSSASTDIIFKLIKN